MSINAFFLYRCSSSCAERVLSQQKAAQYIQKKDLINRNHSCVCKNNFNPVVNDFIYVEIDSEKLSYITIEAAELYL